MKYRFVLRGKRVNVIAAMSSQGLIALQFTSRTVDGDVFHAFLSADLVPNTVSYDGSSPLSVVVMDNSYCSVHHVDQVTHLLRDTGIKVVYTPPHSPDYTPIELAFAYIKQYLKEHEDLKDIVKSEDLITAAFQSWITCCG